MYERDMSDTEIIILRLNQLSDNIWKLYEISKKQYESSTVLLQEISDILQMILQNQNQVYLISGLTPGNLKDMCGNITCNHHIDYHKLFDGCQVSECECEQFYRKENDA